MTRTSSLTSLLSVKVTPFEALVMRRFSDLRSHGWVSVLFLVASRLGDGPLWWAVSLVLLAFGTANTRWAVLTAAVAVALSVILFLTLKRLTGRPRPYQVWSDLPCLALPPDQFSFPSGHTMTAFAVWSALAATVPGCSPVLLPLAVLIGLSRVFLGLHYPSDVLAGALLGSLVGGSTAALLTRGTP